MKIENRKLDFSEKAKPKIGSLEKASHKPGGGDVKIDQNSINFKGNVWFGEKRVNSWCPHVIRLGNGC